MNELSPRGEPVEVCLEPDEHAVADSRRVSGVVAERVAELVERRRHRQPDQEGDHAPDDEEVEEDRNRLGDAMAAEPFDARPDRGRQRHLEEQEDEDDTHLPDPEGERGDCNRGGGCLRHADGEVAVRCRVLGGLRLHVRPPRDGGALQCSGARLARR